MAQQAQLDPTDFLRTIAEAGQRVRLGRGVVGKTGHALLALLGIWAVIAWRLGPSLVLDIALALVGIAASGAFYWWTKSIQSFAERNPAQAMLDGAEFLKYKKFEAAAKGGLVDFGNIESEDAPQIIKEHK